MMSGNLQKMDSLPDNKGVPGPVTPGPVRKLANGRQSPTSPLKLFGQAKKKINDIYTEISTYITESNDFVTGVQNDDDTLLTADQSEQVEKYTAKVNRIREMLQRDRMKVAFFGRTSNGKSTVINAMLRAKILPSGIGHTTNCFVQVEGSDSDEAYIMGEDEVRRSVQDVRSLASALSSVKLDPDSLLRICWPKDKLPLLRDDIILVDSPGVDVTPNIDQWIDKHCMDADVFVLVANAESTLMQTEKNFFFKVRERLSNPNVFIINNRWDASASEPDSIDEVRKQHTERAMAFLVDELHVMEKHEAEERVYFVSAREALISRSNGEAGTPTPTGALVEGYQGRLFEFANFERKFQECISHSAVQTKFAQHTSNGKSITSDIRGIMKDVYNNSTEKKNNRIQEYGETQDQLDYTEKQLDLLIGDIKDKIKQMTEEVDNKVSSALSDEIRRLAILVDEFERPFHPDPMMLNIYKKELHFHIEECLSRNLHAHCSSFIHQVLDVTNHSMEERLTGLLPEDARLQAANLVPARDFEVAYRLDCRNLCADFHEDVEFRFSLGITSLMNRFLGPRGTKAMLSGYSGVPRPLSTPAATPTGDGPAIQEADAVMLLLGSMTSLYSRSTVGALAIGGVIGKAAGWRILAVCGAIYGIVYMYERLTWTSKAREKAFKRQYVDYASSKLKLIVDLTSANCSHQVQQELSSTFSRLCHQVDMAKGELEENMKLLKADITKLDEIAARGNFLRNKAGYLDSELNSFITQYLKPDSQL